MSQSNVPVGTFAQVKGPGGQNREYPDAARIEIDADLHERLGKWVHSRFGAAGLTHKQAIRAIINKELAAS